MSLDIGLGLHVASKFRNELIVYSIGIIHIGFPKLVFPEMVIIHRPKSNCGIPEIIGTECSSVVFILKDGIPQT